MVDHDRFTYRLEPLPEGKTVSLGEAMSSRYTAASRLSATRARRCAKLVGESAAVQKLVEQGKQAKETAEKTREKVEPKVEKDHKQVGQRGRCVAPCHGRHFIDIKDDKLGNCRPTGRPAPGEIARPGAILFGVADIREGGRTVRRVRTGALQGGKSRPVDNFRTCVAGSIGGCSPGA